MSISLARRALVFSLVLALVAALAAPSFSKPGKSKGKKRGKSAIGVVTAFDGLALSVEFKDGSTFDGTLAEDAKIKLEHRGKPAAKGNPTKGSVEDIDVGDKVLKMKARNGVVTKMRLRDVASEVEDANGGECKPPGAEEGEEAEGEEAEGEEAEEEAVEEEVVEEEVEALETEPEAEVVEEEVEEEVVEEEDADDRTCADKVDKSDEEDEAEGEEIEEEVVEEEAVEEEAEAAV